MHARMGAQTCYHCAMRSILIVFSIMALFLSAATIARADSGDLLAEARSQFDAGDYLPAAENARAAGNAEGLALATQITCYYGLQGILEYILINPVFIFIKYENP